MPLLTPGVRLQVFSIKGDGSRATWTKAGSAWINRDGSMNIYLDVLPLDGKLHVRDALPKPKKEEPAPAHERPEDPDMPF